MKEGTEGEESTGTDGEEPLQGTEDGASQDGDEASETQKRPRRLLRRLRRGQKPRRRRTESNLTTERGLGKRRRRGF